METDDVAKLITEIVNLTLAARSFEEATSALRSQRDEARRAAAALQLQVRLAAGGMALALLFSILMVLSAQVSEDASWNPLEALGRIHHVMAESDVLRMEQGAAPSVRLDLDSDCVVYRVDVIGRDAEAREAREALINASDGAIVGFECGDTDP